MRSTTAEFFLDTNILLYAISTLPLESRKADTALQLVHTLEFGLSTQVLQEFYAVATTKLRHRLAAGDAMRLVQQWSKQPLCVVDAHVITAAMHLQQSYQLSYWDAAILAAAHEINARVIYTEDFQHGRRYGSVEVINPFLPARM
jgi:predicted nucleic acid-binding protein